MGESAPTCGHPGCDKRVHCAGLCAMHHGRQYRDVPMDALCIRCDVAVPRLGTYCAPCRVLERREWNSKHYARKAADGAWAYERSRKMYAQEMARRQRAAIGNLAAAFLWGAA